MIKINAACKGILVMTSKTGEPIHIGDTVKITIPKNINAAASNKDVVYIGELTMRRREGVMIRAGGYCCSFPVKFEKSGWIWELLKTKP